MSTDCRLGSKKFSLRRIIGPSSTLAPSASARALSRAAESVIRSRGSRRIMKYDAERIAIAVAHGAHAVTQVDAVAAFHAVHRTMAHRENHGIAAPQGDDVGARLHAGPLLGDDEFAPSEVLAGLAE